MAGQTKAITVSIFSVTNGVDGVGDGFHPAWRGGRGDELDDCPFSFDEGSADGELPEALHRTYSITAPSSGAEAKADFSGVSMQGVDLHGHRISRGDFSYANLRMANCTRATLPEASFRFADLTFVDFDLAELAGGDFFCADLCKASLRGARLCAANLAGADLEHADFLEADLRGANLTDADVRNTRFSGALFDARTALPFSRDEARRLGMIESPIVEGGIQ